LTPKLLKNRFMLAGVLAGWLAGWLRDFFG
jgi:hypothetical protein